MTAYQINRDVVKGAVEVLALMMQDLPDDVQWTYIEYLEYLLGKREDEFDEYSHVDEWGDDADKMYYDYGQEDDLDF